MPEVEIPYLEALGSDPILLLTKEEQLRLAARAEDLMAQSQEYQRADLPEEATAFKIQATVIEKELKLNHDLMKLPEAKVKKIVFAEPTLDGLKQVRAILATGDNGKAVQTAYELLAPHEADGDGEPGLRFVPTVEQACFKAFFPDMSEERRFFSKRRSTG